MICQAVTGIALQIIILGLLWDCAHSYYLHEYLHENLHGPHGVKIHGHNAHAADRLAARSSTGDIFNIPISNIDPSTLFGTQSHPIKPPAELSSLNAPIHTNKFYENMLLDSRDMTVWTHPYGLWWNGQDSISFSHPGSMPEQLTKRATSYYAPTKVETFQFGAAELTPRGCHIEVSDPEEFSINAKVVSNSNANQYLTLPLVYGMGFVTGIYNGGLTPKITTPIGISAFIQNNDADSSIKMHKYIVVLNSGDTWVLYSSVELQNTDPNTITASAAAAEGTVIQLAHILHPQDDTKYDQTSGRYLTGASVDGSVTKSTGQGVYRIQYSISQAPPGPVIVFALPHHVQAFTSTMSGRETGIALESNILGEMQGYYTDVLEMQENVPTFIGFYPWTSINKSIGVSNEATDNDAAFNPDSVYTQQMQQKIAEIAEQEIEDQAIAPDEASSMYFSGKELDKLAMLGFTAKYLAYNDEVASKALDKFKQEFSTYTSNKQQHPLTYDSSWKGLISTAGLTGDGSADFGNTYYNDHHFHYGYFVHSAAVAGVIDRQLSGNDNWIQQNKEYVNCLIRDVANPTQGDKYFPTFRNFDWFTGHSWAKGLYSAQDGRDEESSSEDYHFAYGMKLWGYLIQDQAMEDRGNLMLGVMRRAMNNYFLYNDSNTVMPAAIVSNKVSGILLENKVMYSTWFGAQPEYIHGIHMMPITPISSFIRGPQYVSEEWTQKIQGLIDGVDGAWKGVLMLNKALFDPSSALEFFTQDDFNDEWLDPGQSRAWSIAYCAGIMNGKAAA